MPLFIELTTVFQINGHGWIDVSFLSFFVCLFVVVVLFLGICFVCFLFCFQ